INSLLCFLCSFCQYSSTSIQIFLQLSTDSIHSVMIEWSIKEGD
ncbi:hypothetical protein PRIPAC_88282, partial [Pristionchus pacificus]